MGFVAGGVVLDKRFIKTLLAAAISVLVTVVPLILALRPEASGADTDPCSLRPAQVQLIKTAASLNSTCQYNQSIESVLWLKADDGELLSAPPPNLARSILLSDYVESHGFRCLDGTPQRIWHQKASAKACSSKWYFQFMGWHERARSAHSARLSVTAEAAASSASALTAMRSRGTGRHSTHRQGSTGGRGRGGQRQQGGAAQRRQAVHRAGRQSRGGGGVPSSTRRWTAAMCRASTEPAGAEGC